MNTEQRAGAEALCATLRAHGHRALLAGGCVRDLLLNTPAKDFDIATSARPEDVEALFNKTVSIGKAFGVIAVMRPEATYEVTTFRRDGPYLDGRHPSTVSFTDEIEDAKRRDFTVNALFFDPEEQRVLDYVGGQEDMARRVIRTVGDPYARFREDHLRLLRAVRFAARLDYVIEPETMHAIRVLAPDVLTTSAERIRDELLKILTEGAARRGFELLDECGLLEQVLPEIAAMKGVDQPEVFHPEGDVFVHTLLLLDKMENPTPELALAALLHDVGKPPTQTFEDRIRFNLHEKVGAEMAEEICRRLRLSRHTIERVRWLVEQHMRLRWLPEMRESKRRRFVREEGFDELVRLCRLDSLASHGDVSTVEWTQDYLANLQPEQVKPTPLLTGHDLIAMGYRPGPQFGRILTAVEDAQLEEQIRTKQEAETFVMKHWPVVP
jgi:poly(A) polymerase